MNTPAFIPEQLQQARLLLGLSQTELARLCGMQQKDISLHETKDTKRLIPVRYILFLASKGVDLNTLFRPGEVRLLSRGEQLAMAAEPPAAYVRLKAATATERKLSESQRALQQLTPQRMELLLRLLEREERSALAPPGEPGEQKAEEEGT